MAITKITQSEIAENSVEGNLADRPSSTSRYGQGRLSPSEIKSAYDRLPKLIIARLNSLIDSISGVSNGELVEGSLADSINTNITDLHTLKDLFSDIRSGDAKDYIMLTENYSLADLYSMRITKGAQAPTALTEGVIGSVYVQTSGHPKLYVCKSDSGGIYIWESINAGINAEASDKVDKTRRIAGIALTSDITAGDLLAAMVISLATEKLSVSLDDYMLIYSGADSANRKVKLRRLVESLGLALNSALSEVRSIAMGATQAVVYNSYADMVTALLAEQTPSLSVGQNIYIGTMQVPDLWVSAVTNTKSSMYTTESAILNRLKPISEGGNETLDLGFYHLKALETLKVDLTSCASADHTHSDYMTSSDVAFAIAQAVGAVINTAI